MRVLLLFLATAFISCWLTLPGQGKPLNTETWKERSISTEKLMADGKFAQAETVLRQILPIAKQEAPDSIALAACLTRLGTAVFEQKKFKQALGYLDEALSILRKNLNDNHSHRTLLWCVVAKAAVLFRSNDYSDAEYNARRAIAYTAAFPDIATKEAVKQSYIVLYWSLVKQNKSEEAKTIESIMNHL